MKEKFQDDESLFKAEKSTQFQLPVRVKEVIFRSDNAKSRDKILQFYATHLASIKREVTMSTKVWFKSIWGLVRRKKET